MVTENFETLFRCNCLGEAIISIRRANGTYARLTGALDGLSTASVYSSGIGKAGAIICFGEGGATESKKDYCLTPPITDGYTADITSRITGIDNDGNNFSEVTIRMIWIGNVQKTIREIGLFCDVGGAISSPSSSFLLERTVLQNPITLNIGEVKIIKYRITNAIKLRGE